MSRSKKIERIRKKFNRRDRDDLLLDLYDIYDLLLENEGNELYRKDFKLEKGQKLEILLLEFENLQRLFRINTGYKLDRAAIFIRRDQIKKEIKRMRENEEENEDNFEENDKNMREIFGLRWKLERYKALHKESDQIVYKVMRLTLVDKVDYSGKIKELVRGHQEDMKFYKREIKRIKDRLEELKEGEKNG